MAATCRRAYVLMVARIIALILYVGVVWLLLISVLARIYDIYGSICDCNVNCISYGIVLPQPHDDFIYTTHP
jgi:hypothetical protein